MTVHVILVIIVVAMLITDEKTILQARAEFELRRRNITFEDWLKKVSPHNTWDPPHLKLMREPLEKIANGEQLQVMFLAPPRHGKSEQNTIHFGAFFLYKNPIKHVLLGAYNQNFANGFSLRARQLYRQSVPFESRKNAVMEWHTDLGGKFMATGLDGAITGRGGHLILLDDPIKDAKKANNKDRRDDLWTKYSVDIFSRREPGASIVLTMTPWHQDDIAGRILNSKDAKNWIVIKLPAEAGKDDLLGRKPGAALWPERYDEEELHHIHDVIGDEYLSLYLLTPGLVTGNIFKRKWFLIQKTDDWPIRFDFIGQYWDTAHKTGKNNDYNVCVTLARYRNTTYLLNVFREKMEFPETKEAVCKLAKDYNPHFIGIEDKSSGQDLVPALSRNPDLIVKPEALPAPGDKELRARSVTPTIKFDRIMLPSGAYWIDDFLDELTMFPRAGHDDQVDAFCHGLNHIHDGGYDLMALIGENY